MALQLTTNRSRRGLTLAGTFFAVFALFVQPLVALNIPAAFAANPLSGETANLTKAAPRYEKTVDTSNLENISLTFDYDARSVDESDGTVQLAYSAGDKSGTKDIVGVSGNDASEQGSVELQDVTASTSLQVVISADTSDFSGNDEIALTKITLSGDEQVSVCTYDFQAQKMWEFTWGYGFTDRNGGAPKFTKQSNGGLVSLNGGPVPAYMSSPKWHWLYVTDKGDANKSLHYDYGFADGTVRTADVTWNDVNGCQIPTVVWGMTTPDAVDPTVTISAPTGVVGNTFTVSGKAHDDRALNRVYVQLVSRQDNKRYGGTTISLIGKGTDAEWSKTYNANDLSLADGQYAAHVSAVDMEGNTGSAGWTQNFTVDSTAPDFAIESPSDGSFVKGIVDVRARVTDEHGIKKILMTVPTKTGNKTYVYEEGKANNSLVKDGDSYRVSIDTTTMNDGVAHIVLRGTDGVGNTRYWNNNAAHRQHTFTVDNTNPHIDNVTFNGTDFKSGDVLRDSGDFVVEMTETNPRRTYVEVQQLVNGAWKKIAGQWSTGTDANRAMVAFDTAVWDESAKYQLKISSDDQAWNHAGSAMPFSIDNTAPRITVKDGYVGNKDQKVFSDVSFSLYDAQKVDYFTLNGDKYERSNNPYSDANFQNIKGSLTNSENNSLVLFDVAGNSSEYVFTYDSQAPDAALDVSPSNPTTNDTVVVTGSADELHIKSHWFEIKTPLGNTYYNTEKMNTTENSHSFELDTTDGAGEYTIRYVAGDHAGNRSDDPNYSNSTVKVVTVTAPAPISENGGSKQPTDKPKNDNDAPTTPQGRSGGTPAATVANGNPFAASAIATPFGTAFAANNGVNTDGNDDATSDKQDDEEVLGATAQSDENGDVLAATDDTTECGKFLGICWYWWIPIVIAIVGAVWFYLATRNRDGKDDMPFGDQPPRRQP